MLTTKVKSRTLSLRASRAFLSRKRERGFGRAQARSYATGAICILAA